MSDGLRSKTIQALGWSFLESFILQAGRFIIGIILARLLFPEQFGLIGMLAIFIAVAQSFLESGFGAALIQKRHPTPTDTSSIFYFNLVVGLAGAGVLWLVAPFVAAFYGHPILTPLTRALSVTVVIHAFGLIQNTILIKEINFKRLTKISLLSGLLSGVIGVVLAVRGFGVWSLAGQQISAAFFRTLFLWLLNPWRPALVFSLASLREMFGFGSRLLLSGLLNQVFNNVYFVAIGRLFSAADLGFFTRALTLQELPSATLGDVVGRVTFPVFSAIQEDPARLKRGMRRALTGLVFINFPLMIGLAVTARPLVLVLLTERWAECIPYLQVLCAVGLLYPLHVINLNLLQALGRSDLFLRLEIFKKVLIVINIALTWRWGISAMIYGMVAASLFSYYLNSYYSGILIDYPLREQVRDLSPYLITAALMGTGVYAAKIFPFPNMLSLLLVQISFGAGLYFALCRLFRLAAFLEVWQAGWQHGKTFRFQAVAEPGRTGDG